jgi:hypothetical protein
MLSWPSVPFFPADAFSTVVLLYFTFQFVYISLTNFFLGSNEPRP